MAEEKNYRSEYRAPHKFQIFIQFNDADKVFQGEFYGELVKIIIEVQGRWLKFPKAYLLVRYLSDHWSDK